MKIEIADDMEVRKREREMQTLVNVIEPDPEYQPIILTDEAYLHDLCGYEDKEILQCLEFYFSRHYEERLRISMNKYAWQVVDDIKKQFPDWMREDC